MSESRITPMKTERFIHHLRVELPPVNETTAEARTRLGALFPRTAVRRMTHLGFLIGSVLDGVAVGSDDAVVYASTFAETRALEDFLASFPSASPALFQTSIHPSAVQQVLIGKQQPVQRLWPLASQRRLLEQALVVALLEPATRVVVVGGEERGTWMLEHGMAAERSFAFGLLLTHDPRGALGAVTLARGAGEAPELSPTTLEFAQAMERRTTVSWRTAHGALSVRILG
jgi:hypothetical protein